jgi:hypothetical protein
VFLPLVIDFAGSSWRSRPWGTIQAGIILCAALSLAGVAVAMIGTGPRPVLVADRPPHAV